MFIVQLVLGVLFNVLLFALCLFLPAGTLDWWRAWVYLGLEAAGTVITTVVIFRARPDLLRERLQSPVQPGQPAADKLLTSLVLLDFAATLVAIPLDRFRWHLLPAPHPAVAALGLLLAAAGWILISLVFRENAFAAPVVKVQAERHHTVIDTGVYRLVRHPMYLGAVLFLAGTALWLESYAAALFTLVMVALLVVRIRY